MLDPYDEKLSRTVLRGEGAERPLTYPVTKPLLVILEYLVM